MQPEGRAASEGQRFLTVLFDEFDAEVLAVLFGFFQKTVGNVVMMDVDGAGSHSDFIPRITIVLTTVSFYGGISAGAFKPRPDVNLRQSNFHLFPPPSSGE